MGRRVTLSLIRGPGQPLWLAEIRIPGKRAVGLQWYHTGEGSVNTLAPNQALQGARDIVDGKAKGVDISGVWRE